MDKGGFFTDGETYERLMGRLTRIAGETFLTWLEVAANRRWLDVGCGNGAFTEQLIDQCAPAAVIAFDPSEEQIAYARKRAGATKAQFLVGDAETIAFGDNAFDAAVMALVLTFLMEPEKAVTRLARMVRAGGWVASYMWDIPGGGSPVTPIYTAMASLGMTLPVRPNPNASRREVMHDLWQTAGLDEIETRVIRVPVTYRDFDEFWDANTLPIGPHGKVIAGMSASERMRLQDRLREQLPAAADGRIVYDAFANAVKGRVPERS